MKMSLKAIMKIMPEEVIKTIIIGVITLLIRPLFGEYGNYWYEDNPRLMLLGIGIFLAQAIVLLWLNELKYYLIFIILWLAMFVPYVLMKYPQNDAVISGVRVSTQFCFFILSTSQFFGILVAGVLAFAANSRRNSS